MIVEKAAKNINKKNRLPQNLPPGMDKNTLGVRHYSGFIASRSMRPMKDEYGNTHMVVDETLRRRMETRLIAKILSFEIREPK